ncbi:MAG TPA: DUF1707 domain-containing protein [Trebonia sp.]|jgi:hypothetical protein|nr:DUF1707 domain-containing protein [Trebonia sp.]
MASGFEMRVGHAERDAVAAELREHYAAGRITLDELNDRLDKTFAAKTKSDLNALMTDLPSAAGAGTGASIGGGSAAGAGSGIGGGTSRGIGAGGSGGWDRGQRTGWGSGRAGQTVGAVLAGLIVMGALLSVGFLSLFGIGAGKPFGIVLILAALAFLRRMIFGRRHHARGSRPSRRW